MDQVKAIENSIKISIWKAAKSLPDSEMEQSSRSNLKAQRKKS